MRILVTGGAGYIGSSLVSELLKEGHKVSVLDNLLWGKEGLNCNLSSLNCKFIEGDVRDTKLVSKLMENQDVIVHLAALVGFSLCENNKEQATDVNVNGTKNIINCLSEDQMLIYASTGSIYGQPKGLTCTEQTMPNPLSHYAKTKLEAEEIVSKRKNVIILRFATAFGVSHRMRLDLLVNQFVYEAVAHRMLTVFGEDDARSIIHIKDVIESIRFTIENRQAMKGQTFNVSLEKIFTKKEIAQHIKKQVYYDLKFENLNTAFDFRNYQVSTEKINALGYYSKTSLDQGITELICAMKEIKVNKQFFNA